MSVDPQTQSLFNAIAAGNNNRVKLLLDSGVAIDSPNERGQTPLAVACRQGNLEIVDLLVAAGAQMQAPKQSNPQPQLDSVLPVHNSKVVDTPGDRLHQQQIPFESLIDLIHQPANDTTEIEQTIPIARQPLVPQYNTDLQRIAANWQDIGSDAEATYTFDLDEVFAAHDADNSVTLDRLDMFVDEIALTSIQRPATEIEFEAGETYAFDLSPDLDRLMVEANNEPDRLSIPIEKWEDSATYVLDDLPQLES
ncbi:MAG: ankyrin repeat domain-containing protein, partial [Chamaesiphon sp.]|nr:ankyrin repeat domain-containing protein [Chamaesiphon sp.]